MTLALVLGSAVLVAAVAPTAPAGATAASPVVAAQESELAPDVGSPGDLGAPGIDLRPRPLETLRPAIRRVVDELDTVAATHAGLVTERERLVQLATERRAAAGALFDARRPVAVARLERARTSVARAQARRDATAAQAERVATQAKEVAMGLYLEGEPLLAEGLLPGRNPLSAVVAHETVRAGVRAATDAHRTVQARLALLEASLERRLVALGRAEAVLGEIDAERNGLEAEAAAAEATVVDIDAQLPLLAFATAVYQDQVVWLLTLGGSPAHRAVEPTLSILGPSRLTAGQLASWLGSPGGGGLEAGRAAELAVAFVEEGAAVGVRGDVAVAQAVLETGGFRFTGSNNFAGIGHCDSCPRGFAYPTVREGVRAQVQLLRAYADAELDPATLPGGPVAGLSLGSLSVKGCCASWWGLTGVWATALHYGGSILRIYESALAHAAALPPEG